MRPRPKLPIPRRRPARGVPGSARLAPIPGLATALLGALALAACGSSQSASSGAPGAAPAGTSTAAIAASTSSSAAPGAGACAAGQLVLAYGGAEGATGHLELTLSLRNRSRHACTLHGYPAARLLDGAGHPLPMRLRLGGGFFSDTRQHPRTVVLDPGRGARYGLSFITNNEYAGARRCATVAAVMARPPGSSRWTRLLVAGGGRPRLAPCGDELVVSPVYGAA